MTIQGSGGICLQGGGEFGPRCRAMDLQVLRRAGPGPVVVTALAGSPGRDYATATSRGARWYRSLGAAAVVEAPDGREEEDAAYQLCRTAGLLVLPGGSPRRLLSALTATKIGTAIREVLAGGGAVSGASAGAMVLCGWTYLPETGTVEAGLGLVPDALVVPHFTGDLRWLARAAPPEGTRIFGLPEQSGVWIGAGAVTGLGADAVTVLDGGRQQLLAAGQTAGPRPVKPAAPRPVKPAASRPVKPAAPKSVNPP
ncbi:MAG TPA: Type 1 glutamine amidotransferase-like domain-containing protein [Mycobacteriales bacterium]|nr:Type 1 glutamine amidotransferase-like domain-containing protein [Mycobacteriales bacterium]